MAARFEEIDWRETPLGAISLRRRWDPVAAVEVFEVKLDDDYLMSSLFTVAEEELARRGLAAHAGTDLDVVVGGLGLGYTARAALEDERVRTLTVVETLGEVLDWHRRGLLPVSDALAPGERVRLVQGDFFALAAGAEGFDPTAPGRLFDAVLLDVDHSPRHVLHPSHAGLYTTEGLRQLASHLHPGGVFALWSDDPPDPHFEAALAEAFGTTATHVVPFPNPYTGGESSNTVYVAH